MLSNKEKSISWTSHQVTVLDEMNSVADGALEVQKKFAQCSEFRTAQTSEAESRTSFKNINKTFNAIGQKFKMKFKVSKFRAVKKWKILRDISCVSLQLKGHITRIFTQQEALGRPAVRQGFSICDMTNWLLGVAAWKQSNKDAKGQSVFLMHKLRRYLD